MKNLKTLGRFALAAMIVFAFSGAGTASATELYKRTEGGITTLPQGSEIKATLVGGTARSTSTGGALLDTCTGGEIAGKTSTAGSSTATAKLSIESLTWTGCLEPTETLVKGELEFHDIKGSTNGTVTGRTTLWKENTTIFGAPCEYTFGESEDLGAMIGAATPTDNAVLSINVLIYARNSFFCPEKRWEATYIFTSPKGLVVEAS